MRAPSRTQKLVGGAALVLAGFAGGAALALTGSASASSNAAPTASDESGRSFDPSKSIRPDEHLLTGTTASKVRAAALAKYPGATVQRVETDSDGVYEAHIVTAAGREVTVEVGKNFAVTGTETHGPGDGHGHGGRGDHDGDGPGDPDGQGGSGDTPPSQSGFSA
jgi:hypothetical protein